MNEERTWIHWLERGLFLMGMLLLVQPVLSSKFFFTVDGPAHAYNASLLLDLISTPAEERGWEVNPVPVPNWTGHLLLALLQIVLDAPEALKVVYVLCLAGLPLAFRAVVKDHVSGPPWASFLALPMAMHLPFSMGYLNFSIGIILLLLVVHRWERLVRSSFAARQWWYLFVLLTVLYFSHLVPFLFALIWLGLQLCCAALGPGNGGGTGSRFWLGHAGRLFLCALPGLLGTLAYLYATWSVAATSSITRGSPDRWHIFSLTFQAANGPNEAMIWRSFLFVIGAVIAGSFFAGPGSRLRRNGPSASLIAAGLAFLVTCTLFATLPDRIGKGGDLLIRMVLIMHLCGLVLIAQMPITRSAGLSIALVACGMIMVQARVRSDTMDRGELRTRSCYEACSKIPPGTTAVTAAFDWSDSHLTELALADQGVLHLSNYEFINPHFLLRWKGGAADRLSAPDHHPLDHLFPFTNMHGALVQEADNIILVGDTPCNLAGEYAYDLEGHLEKTHELFVRNAVCRIYRRC